MQYSKVPHHLTSHDQNGVCAHTKKTTTIVQHRHRCRITVKEHTFSWELPYQAHITHSIPLKIVVWNDCTYTVPMVQIMK